MTRNDAAPFSAMLSLLAEQYGKTLSRDLIALYFDSLRDLTIEEVRGALSAHATNTESGQFMPKIADIIRHAKGNADVASFAALAEIERAFSDIGAWRTAHFEDSISMRVVRDMGGWPRLCEMDAEEWRNFGTKEFMRRYRAYRDSPRLPDAPIALPGRFDITNNALGHGTPELDRIRSLDSYLPKQLQPGADDE